MKILDARSGREMTIGDTMRYPDLYSWPISTTKRDERSYRLLTVKAGLFSAEVTIRRLGGQVVTLEAPVRYFHPDFRLQRVVVIPA